jgi:uncharacterized protein
MPLTEHPSDQPLVIQSLGADHLIINHTRFEQSLILTADFQILPWGVQEVSQLTRALLEPLLQGKPEVVLIGTGKSLHFLPPALLAVFYERGVGVESMTTAAAVKTYTVLTSEDRKVAAGFLL